MRKTSEVIKEFRRVNNYTVAELAEKVGVSQVFMTQLENEKKKLSEKTLENLKLVLSKQEIKEIVEYENYLKTPDAIKNKINLLEKQLKNKITKREKLQKEEFMNQAQMMFNDESISEEDKEKLLSALQEAFYTAKIMNKRKK